MFNCVLVCGQFGNQNAFWCNKVDRVDEILKHKALCVNELRVILWGEVNGHDHLDVYIYWQFVLLVLGNGHCDCLVGSIAYYVFSLGIFLNVIDAISQKVLELKGIKLVVEVELVAVN